MVGALGCRDRCRVPDLARVQCLSEAASPRSQPATDDHSQEHSMTSNEDLLAELVSAANVWLLDKNKYTLESLRDAKKAALARMNAPETADSSGLRDLLE